MDLEMTCQKMLDEARSFLGEMRHVADGGESHTVDEALTEAKRLARGYFRSGWKFLKEMSVSELAAILVSLGDDFHFTKEGLFELSSKADEGPKDRFNVLLEELQDWVQMNARTTKLFQEAFQAGLDSQVHLVKAVCLAAQLKKDRPKTTPKKRSKRYGS